MKKLKLEDLAVSSFTTSESDPDQGTVAGYESGDGYCSSEPKRSSCSMAMCTGTTSAGQSEFCVSAANCTGGSCHPYTCSGSYDYTFCGCDTEYDYTCAGQC